jgi:hypothetical protein
MGYKYFYNQSYMQIKLIMYQKDLTWELCNPFIVNCEI